MPLPQQQLPLAPVQLRCIPALPCSFDYLQGIVQQIQSLFKLSCDFTCRGQESYIVGPPQFRSSRTISVRTAAQKRYPLRHVTIFHLAPAAEDRSRRTPERETLLGRHGNQPVYPVEEDCVILIFAEQEQNGAQRQARCQRQRMNQSLRLSDCRIVMC